MRRSTSQRHELSGLFALLLFGVFAVSILSVLLTGSGVYNRIVDRDRDAYERRTAAQYVATKVRQAKDGGSVSVTDFGGESAITLTDRYGDYVFITRIYCHDGWICELFTEGSGDTGDENDGFSPEDGEKIIRADALSASVGDGILNVELTESGGKKTSLCLSLRGEEASE